MREALICEPLRTSVGRFGMFRDVSAPAWGATVERALIERSGIAGGAIEDVLFAQCYPTMDAPALSRVVGLDAGLPIEAGGQQLDRRCRRGSVSLNILNDIDYIERYGRLPSQGRRVGDPAIPIRCPAF